MPLFIALLFFINVFFSCKKTNSSFPPASVVGQWNWIKTYPGGNPSSYPHYPLTPENTGSKEVLSFDENKKFSRAINDTLKQSGTYTTGHGTYQPYQGGHQYTYDSICYFINGSKANVDYYNVLSRDTLLFSSSLAGIIGGGSKYYVK